MMNDEMVWLIYYPESTEDYDIIIEALRMISHEANLNDQQ